jgi:hypothetical protein
MVAVLDTWRLSQARKSPSTMTNSEPLIGSMWSSLMIRSSPDLSASRTTAAALPLLASRWLPQMTAIEFYPLLYSLSASTCQSGGKQWFGINVKISFVLEKQSNCSPSALLTVRLQCLHRSVNVGQGYYTVERTMVLRDRHRKLRHGLPSVSD